jgi:hypothetical protein
MMRGYPRIPWLTPVPRRRPTDGALRFTCALCVARGTAEQWPTEGEVLAHLRRFHHLNPDG